MKKLLILLSTYNGEKYLESQLDSILSQNKSNFKLDILVRDDGSTDNTKNILDKYLSNYNNIKCKFCNNIGACNSFLDLINICDSTYDYYAFCDQDDIWLKNKMMIAIEQLDKFKNTIPNLYYSGQILVDNELNVICNHSLDTNRSRKANFIFNQMAGCTCVFNKELMLLLKKYKPSNVYGHDVWTYKLCVSVGGNIYVDKESYIYYRQHDNNVVGLTNNIKGRFERAKNYIFKYNCSSYSYEIYKEFNNLINDEFKVFILNIINSKKSLKSKMKLLFDKEIIFNSISLRIIFIIKIIINKL